MDHKLLLGGVASLLGLIGYAPYIKDVLAGKTKPHAFSWLAWALLEIIAFSAQLSSGGGAGTWVTGLSAGVTLFIALKAVNQKNKQIKPTDWVAFGGALLGIALWKFSKDPLLAVVSVSIADALAFVPTFRKSYVHPYEETLTEYVLSFVKWLISIFALQTVSLTTALYPASLVVTHGAFIIMCYIQRQRVKQ